MPENPQFEEANGAEAGTGVGEEKDVCHEHEREFVVLYQRWDKTSRSRLAAVGFKLLQCCCIQKVWWSNRTTIYPHEHFAFLGFTFRSTGALDRRKKAFTNFLPAVSAEALKRMRKAIRGCAFTVRRREHSTNWRGDTIQDTGLVELLRGILSFGDHRLFQFIDGKLMQWAMRKYKTLLRHKTCSARWLCRVKKQAPRMFFHWSVVGNQVG